MGGLMVALFVVKKWYICDYKKHKLMSSFVRVNSAGQCSIDAVSFTTADSISVVINGVTYSTPCTGSEDTTFNNFASSHSEAIYVAHNLYVADSGTSLTVYYYDYASSIVAGNANTTVSARSETEGSVFFNLAGATISISGSNVNVDLMQSGDGGYKFAVFNFPSPTIAHNALSVFGSMIDSASARSSARALQFPLACFVTPFQDGSTGNFTVGGDLTVLGDEEVNGVLSILRSVEQEDAGALVIRNDKDEDFRNAISIRAGETATHRRYFEFLSHDGVRTGLMGFNAQNGFIAYNDASNYHYIASSDLSNTDVNSGSTFAVRINRDEVATGTGGLIVYNGDAQGTFPSDVYGSITSQGVLAYNGGDLIAYHTDNAKFISISADGTMGYINSNNDLYLNTSEGDIWFASNFTLQSRMNLATQQFGLFTTSPSSALDVAGDIETGDTNWVYFGDPSTDGTWRMGRDGLNFVHQLRESGSYVTKNTITP